jgi:hypothetical protein
MSNRWFLALALLSSLSLAACQPVTAPAAAPQEAAQGATMEAQATADATAVLFAIDESGLSGPAETPAGWVNVTFQNNGQAPHILFLNGLDDGVTAQETLSAPSFDPNQALVSGVILGPGERMEAGLDLTAGRHYFAYEFGVEGMPAYVEFAVADTESSAAAPAPGVTVDAADFAFVLPDELPGGAQWWQMNNKGVQPHDLSIFALGGEATVETLQAQMEAAEAEGLALGAGVKMPIWIAGAGQSTQLKVDLAPGQYVVFCQAPDFSTLPPGPRHWHKGMVRTFTVVE